MLNHRSRLTGLLAVVTLSGALAGCKTGYTADIRNESGEPVYARLVRSGGAGQATAIAAERIPPGDRKGVSRIEVPTDWAVYLSVDSVGNPGYPMEQNLSPGTTIFTVTRDGSGKLRLEQIGH